MTKTRMYFFDMDDTLVTVKDKTSDAKKRYLSLEYQEEIPCMMDLFNSLKQKHSVGIITARHPLLTSEIRYKFNIDLVITRNFCLDTNETGNEELTELFYDKAIDEKVSILNNYAKIFNITYFDDMANRFWNHDKLSKNVTVCLPLHNQKEMIKQI